MSAASSFSDLTAESSDGHPSAEEARNDVDVAVSAVDHYNPKDLVSSWMKVAPTTQDNNLSPAECPPPLESTKTFASRRVICSISALLILVILSMVVAIAVVASKDSTESTPASASGPPPLVFPPSTPESTNAPDSPTVSPAPPMPTIDTDLLDLLVSVSPDAGLALADTTSPQYLAFSWLALDPKLSEYLEKRKFQRYVLATLYFSTSGDQWKHNKGWLSDEHECDWQFGKDSEDPCGSNGSDIIDLGLTDNNLNGTLPPELALLSDSMIHLELQQNALFGSIPSAIAHLKRLSLLDLSNNGISGAIPPNVGTMQNLTRLILQNNELAGHIPEEVAFMSSLIVLRLSNNRLSGNIPNLGSLSMLEELGLHENDLEGEVPADICELGISEITVDCEEVLCSCCGEACLQSFLSAASFDSGDGLSKKKSPQSMAFSWLLSDPNLILYESQQMVQRYALATVYYGLAGGDWRDESEFLDASKHECSWDFSKKVSQFTIVNVEASSYYSDEVAPKLAVDGDMGTRWASNRNDPQWIRVDLGESRILDSIQLDWEDAYPIQYRIEVSTDGNFWRSVFTEDNGQGGTVSISLANSIGRYVQIFSIEGATQYGCSIWEILVRGPLPSDAEACDSDNNLLQVKFDGNDLTGSLPQEVGLLSNLVHLNLSNNKIWGSIPSQIGLLASLETLDLSFNSLTSTVPTELGNLSKLQFLSLSENFLSGVIPREIGGIASLEKVFLDVNSLTGVVPDDVCDLGIDDLRVDCDEVACNCCGTWCK